MERCVKKVCLTVVVSIFLVLLVLGAGCVNDEQTNPDTVVATPTETATAGQTASATPTPTQTESSISGVIYNTSNASVTLTDQTGTSLGVSGINAAKNSAGTLVMTTASNIGSSMAFNSENIPVYQAVDVSNPSGNFAGLITLNYVVPAAFVKDSADNDPTQVVMMHYDAALGWTALDTFYLGTNESSGDHIYASITNSFSPFAIVSVSEIVINGKFYDLTESSAYPEFIGDVHATYKTQVVLSMALNQILSELAEDDTLNVDRIIDDAIDQARSEVDESTLVPYNDEGGSSAATSRTISSAGGNVGLILPLSGSVLTGLLGSSASTGSLLVTNVLTSTDENPIDDIEVSDTIDAEVYQTMDITATNLNGNVFLTFRIPQAFLDENNWRVDDVALLHQMSNGKWEILPTSYDEDTKTFTARAPATFSPFAIANVGRGNVDPELGSLEPTVLRFASTNAVVGKTYNDYYLSQMMKISTPLLVQTDEDGDYISGLAMSWDSNADATEWTFTLDPAYVWNDGTLVTGADVKWTLDAGRMTSSGLVNVTSITTTDETVTFHLDTGNSNFLSTILMQNIYPKHFWETIPDPATYTSNTFIGCGPYYVKDIDLFSSVVTFAQNPYWAGDKPYYDLVEIHSYATIDGANAALKSGQADAFWSYGSGYPIVYAPQTVSANRNMAYERLGYSGFSFLTFNMINETSPGYDINFREAISYALDYEYIIASAYAGAGSVGTRGLIPDLYDDRSLDYDGMEYNVTKANLILNESGYNWTGTYRTDKNGNPMKVRILASGSGTDRYDVGLLMHENYLPAIGIDSEFIAKPTAPVNDWAYEKYYYNYDLMVTSATVAATGGGAGFASNYFKSTSRPTAENVYTAALGLCFNVKDSVYLDLCDEIAAETDPSLKIALEKDLLDYYADEIIAVPISWKQTCVIYNDRIDGWFITSNMHLLNIETVVNAEPK